MSNGLSTYRKIALEIRRSKRRASKMRRKAAMVARRITGASPALEAPYEASPGHQGIIHNGKP